MVGTRPSRWFRCCLASAWQVKYPFFFFNDTATTEIYTLSLHDALPISVHGDLRAAERHDGVGEQQRLVTSAEARDVRSEEHTSELQSQSNLVCRLLLEKKKNN